MPSYTRGRRRDVTSFVAVNPVLMYGFKTKDLSALAGVSSADLSAQLGHTAQSAIPSGRLVVIGANAPKPDRVSKKLIAAAGSQGSVSTFCAYNRLTNAIAGGWTMAKQGRDVGLRTDGRSVTAIVPMSSTNGLMYCYTMNRADFESYGAELGLVSASSITTEAEINRLVKGSTLPRPGRAMKVLSTGATVSTFYAPEKRTDLQQPNSGWRVIDRPRLAPTVAAPAPTP